MPKDFIQVILVIAFLSLTTPFTSHSTTITTGQPRVVLDPGHDSRDTGMTSTSGIEEHIITLELATQIAAELEDTAQVTITRIEDNALTIQERTAVANQTRASLFITLHTHASAPGESYIFFRDKPGTTTGIPGKATAGSKQFAELTAARLKTSTAMKVLVRIAPIATLDGLLMPSILLEPFSISQIPEQPGKRQEFIAPFAKAIAAAVNTYFKNVSDLAPMQ